MQRATQTAAVLDKEQGAVYTPGWVVGALLDGLCPTRDDVVLEPSCGRGAFVVPLLERVRGDWTARTLLAWMDTHLHAVDIDAAAVADLRAVLSAWFARTFGVDVPPDRFTCVQHGDGLDWPRALPYTAVIGNPPYVRFQNLSTEVRTKLATRFRSCESGNVDIYYAFIEKALCWADRTAFVVPHGFLTTKSGRRLRAMMDGAVERVDDYGVTRVFPGVGTYVALVFLNKNKTDALQPVRHVPSGACTPFRVDPPKAEPVRKAMPGIATLCDAAFAVRRRADGTFVSPMTGMVVESTFVRPLVKITTLHHQDVEAWDSFILFPYGPDNKPVPAEVFARSGPLTWAHLCAVRAKLDARDKGDVADYPAWYAYGRSQGLSAVEGPEVLVVPAMVGGHSVPRLLDTRPFAPYGRPVFSSGYVVDKPTESDKAALLSPAFLEAIAEVGSPRPAKHTIYHSVASSLVKTFVG